MYPLFNGLLGQESFDGRVDGLTEIIIGFYIFLASLSHQRFAIFSRFFASTFSFSFVCSAEEAMGRKAGNLYINPKKFGSIAKPCMKEMVSFLNCMGLNKCKDENCEKQKQLLSVCMQGQADQKSKSWGNINYHLQRLTRGRK